MEFLYFLEKLRMPGLNELMLAITTFGEETAFLVIALIMFWCVDKRRGYYVLSVGFLGTLANQFVKLLCRVPRPWVLDPNFTILEQAREAAAGYSFPSGHTQNAVGVLGAIARTEKRKWLQIAAITLAALVGFSRMYIGVHTPQDVLAAAGMAVILIIVLYPLMMKGDGSAIPYVLAGMIILSAVFTCYVEMYPFPQGTDLHNLESGLKNAYTMLGCTVGMFLVYIVENKYVHFDVKAVWWVQVLKAVAGFAVVLIIKEGTRAPLEALFAGHMAARAVRYFLIVLTAGVLWPMTFPLFSRLGKKEYEHRRNPS